MFAGVQDFEDIFASDEAKQILKNKYVVIIGDSVTRGVYKDLVKFLQTNNMLSREQLKRKGELVFENDSLLEGGEKGEMTNDITYSEVREYKTPYYFIRFYFITRCYSDYFISICEDIKSDWLKPDLVIMNSGCWDITRYGVHSKREYKKNLPAGIFSLGKVLPDTTLFLWLTTMPLSRNVRGGFMVPEAECHKLFIREDILEANYYAVKTVQEYGLDLLDLHYYFRNHVQHRMNDGIHWNSTAHRRVTNLILNYLCDMWNINTPGRQRILENPSLLEPESNNSDLDDLGNSSGQFQQDVNNNMAYANEMGSLLMPPSYMPFPNDGLIQDYPLMNQMQYQRGMRQFMFTGGNNPNRFIQNYPIEMPQHPYKLTNRGSNSKRKYSQI